MPAIALDETGRDWDPVLARSDVLVFDNASDLCRAAAEILREGIDTGTWEQVRTRIQGNFGALDDLAISRMRTRILEACGIDRSSAEEPLETVEAVS